ncbi:MAG: hypothetical protein JSU74_13265 [Candidatus Zixiibacteriota bacterium]|nr:MAG: hypothetical protein JSU74_13265 [candidate division Zixibacteria bacterium]
MDIFKALRKNRFSILTVAVPFVIYLLLTMPLSDWIIDDAGITFAYARSLAGGHGLVSQPGAEPVEGYSNLLWLLMMVPFFLLRVFDPFIVPKIVGAVLVLFTFIFLSKTVRRYFGIGHFGSFVILILVSSNTSFAVWACSGLENALFVALITFLFYYLVRMLAGDESLDRSAVVCAVVTVGIGLTRPDGVVYAAMFPAAVLLRLVTARPVNLKPALSAAGLNVALFAVCYGASVIFRYYYFGEWMPNTYYAKGGPSFDLLTPALTLQEPFLTMFLNLIVSMVGTKARFFVLGFIVVASTLWLSKQKKWTAYVLLLIFTFIPGFVFIIMPPDWMPEYRFATPFFPFIYALISIQVIFIIRLLFGSGGRVILVGSIVTVLSLAASAKIQLPRMRQFHRQPTVSLKGIAGAFADRFNNYADALQLDDGSVLLPDLGGTLYYSRLRVYDLARLTDKVIARTLKKNHAGFYDYVFDTIKPTFIHIHGNWTYAARFDDDPRFRRDYIPIEEYEDQWILNRLNLKMMSGNYVRRDVIAGKEEQLLELLREI